MRGRSLRIAGLRWQFQDRLRGCALLPPAIQGGRLQAFAGAWNACLTSVAALAVVVLHAQIVYEFFERNTERIRLWFKPGMVGTHSA